MKPRYYAVTWLDSAGWAGWAREDEVVASAAPVTVTSVGEIVRRTRRDVVIAAGRGDNGEIHDATTIPRSVIRRVRRLR